MILGTSARLRRDCQPTAGAPRVHAGLQAVRNQPTSYLENRRRSACSQYRLPVCQTRLRWRRSSAATRRDDIRQDKTNGSPHCIPHARRRRDAIECAGVRDVRQACRPCWPHGRSACLRTAVSRQSRSCVRACRAIGWRMRRWNRRPPVLTIRKPRNRCAADRRWRNRRHVAYAPHAKPVPCG